MKRRVSLTSAPRTSLALLTFLLTTLGACHQPGATIATHEPDRASPAAPPANCPYEWRSWPWNISDADFFCVMDDLGARAGHGDVQAFRDLIQWKRYIQGSELSEQIPYVIGKAYERLGYSQFMHTITPLRRWMQIQLCADVLDEIGADRQTWQRFCTDLHATPEEVRELPYYIDGDPHYADEIPSPSTVPEEK